MAEDMGPCEDDCPKGILVLLTDTESKYAKEWRERCWAKIRDKKQNRQSLASIKIGEIIEFERGGVTIRAEKMAPAYQFKTPWFKVVGEFEYVHKTEIKDWRIVADIRRHTVRNTPNFNDTMQTKKVTTRAKKTRQTKPQTPKTDFFTVLCRSDLKVECVKEHKFHPTRKWRFDYAIPTHKIAIEVEGGVWTGGRHTSPKGFLNDMEKYNTATVMGWRVLRTIPDELCTNATLDMIRQTMRYSAEPQEAPICASK